MRFPPAEEITDAAHVLIAMIRGSRHSSGRRSNWGEMSLDVELRSGVTETWKITIEKVGRHDA